MRTERENAKPQQAVKPSSGGKRTAAKAKSTAKTTPKAKSAKRARLVRRETTANIEVLNGTAAIPTGYVDFLEQWKEKNKLLLNGTDTQQILGANDQRQKTRNIKIVDFLSIFKNRTPVRSKFVLVLIPILIFILGFWTPQIVRFIGIPIDPAPFSAIYFQYPSIVEAGITSGDLVVIDIKNGDRSTHVYSWRAVSDGMNLVSGKVRVLPGKVETVAVPSIGALNGYPLQIYASGISRPLTIKVV